MSEESLFDFDLDLIPLNREEREIHERALSQAAHYRTAEAALVETIDAVDRLRIYEKFRLSSTYTYCVSMLRLSEAVAYYFITVTRKSRQIPELRAAIATGQVSISKAARVCAVITPENQAVWIEKAKGSSKADLEREVAKAAPEETRRPTVKSLDENRTSLRFEVDDKFMKRLKRARDLESRRRAKDATIPEVLSEGLNVYLNERDPIERANRAQQRKSDKSKDTGTTVHRPKPSGVMGPSPVSRPVIPAVVRHHVNLRDRGLCQARLPDGKRCGSGRFTQVHHVTRRADGGKDLPENLVTLCSEHHRQWHKHDDLNV